MKPIALRVQNVYSQTGVEKDPVILWKYGAGTGTQTAYEISLYESAGQGPQTSHESLPYEGVGTGPRTAPDTAHGSSGGAGRRICTTGKVFSSAQNNILLPCNLAEQTEYVYRVRVWDEKGRTECSDDAFFLSGVVKWRGKWIGNGTGKPFLARKKFILGKGTQGKAALSVCVPGQYEIRLNGRKVGSYAYEGSQTDFNRHVHYSTYDVTGYLKDGENVLMIEAANGWYLGDDDGGRRYFYTLDKGYEPFGNCLALLAQLKVCEEYIVTDESWQVSPSSTTLADIYGSEDMDYTVEERWENAREVEGPKGEVIPADYPPVIVKQSYAPRHIDPDRMIYDFGQNMSSQFELRIRGNRGQKVKLIPAEKLAADGDIEQTVNTYSVLTLSGGEDVFRQRFSVNGARWYKIEGAKISQILDFRSHFVTSSAARCGEFSCSDERLNRIFRLVESAIDSNLNHVHTDCPTIEKLGWLEPDHLMAKSVMYLRDVDTLWSKIAMDMRDSQYREGESDWDNGAFPHEYGEGLVPSIAPRYARFITDWKEGSFWDIIPWGSSIILAAYEQYLFYGNRRILEDNYESAKRYLDYLTRQYEDYNRLYGKSGGERFICAGLGDWGVGQNRGRSRENIETAFYYHDLTIMAEIADLLGKADAEAFRQQAQKVRLLYNQSLLVKENGKAWYRAYDTGGITQSDQAIPLCFGMVPEEDREKVSDTLIGLCRGQHLMCGEIGLVFILRELARRGRNDIILEMILQKEHPSYLRFVEQGETTLPEFWRDDARSRNHDMMGHIMEWFFTEVAGVKGSAGFESVTIAPCGMKFLENFHCIYESVRGAIRVEWDGRNLKVETPCNMSVSVERNVNETGGENRTE